MRSTRSGLLGAVVALGLMLGWLSPPTSARALEVVVGPEGFARVAVPAVVGAASLWVDVEAPGLTAADVIVLDDGTPTALRDTPFGAGVILPHDGSAALLDVGVLVAASPDIAITLADADGRVLLGDAARVELDPVDPGQVPTVPPTPSPTASATTAGPTVPSATPTDTTPPTATPVVPSATAAPSALPTAAPPPGRPGRPGLPSTGADVPALASATVVLALAAAALASTRKVER